MPDLPSGTVTFLFTDIEGSTALWDRPTAPRSLTARSNALPIRGKLPRHYPTYSKRAEALGHRDIAGPLVGDEARAIEEALEGGHEATLCVRVGDALLRLTAVGPGNPMADIEVLLSRSMPSPDSRP